MGGLIMKKTLSAVLVFLLILLMLTSCSNSDKLNSNSENVANSVDNETQENQETEPTTTEHQLYEDYKLLAYGTDSNNNTYYLVATQEEHASGTDIKIGVIKNNEWLVALDDNTPFHHVQKGEYDDYNLECGCDSIYDCNSNCFGYIGKGCFSCGDKIVFNADSQKSINLLDSKYYYDGLPYTLCIKKYSNIDDKIYKYINADDGKVLAIGNTSSQNNYGNSVALLDLNTMEFNEIFKNGMIRHDHDHGYVFPLSEGLFAFIVGYSNDEWSGFYNLNGEKVIDLSHYKNIYDDVVYTRLGGHYGTHQSLVFIDGQCAINITNENGTKFRVIYDTKGNIVSETEIN